MQFSSWWYAAFKLLKCERDPCFRDWWYLIITVRPSIKQNDRNRFNQPSCVHCISEAFSGLVSRQSIIDGENPVQELQYYDVLHILFLLSK
jgi:hypothetical protein